MANTYSQLYTHVVFAVKGRANLISPTWRTNLFKYITGIVTNKDQKMMVIDYKPMHNPVVIKKLNPLSMEYCQLLVGG